MPQGSRLDGPSYVGGNPHVAHVDPRLPAPATHVDLRADLLSQPGSSPPQRQTYPDRTPNWFRRTASRLPDLT
ncbi:hypothetical protein ACFX2I_039751 [Malus domestica]